MAQPSGGFFRRMSTMAPSSRAMIASVVGMGLRYSLIRMRSWLSPGGRRSRDHQRARRGRGGLPGLLLEPALHGMGEERPAEWGARGRGQLGLRPVARQRARDRWSGAGGGVALLRLEDVGHLGEAVRVAGAALRREVRLRGLLGGAPERLLPLRLIDEELAGRDLVDPQPERAQRVLL